MPGMSAFGLLSTKPLPNLRELVAVVLRRRLLVISQLEQRLAVSLAELVLCFESLGVTVFCSHDGKYLVLVGIVLHSRRFPAAIEGIVPARSKREDKNYDGGNYEGGRHFSPVSVVT